MSKRIFPILGDAIVELVKVQDRSVQAVIADPPYFNVDGDDHWGGDQETEESYLRWCDHWVFEAMRVLKDDGLCFIFGQPGKREQGFIHLASMLIKKYQFHDLIVWDRAVGYNERQDSFTSQYEMILVLRKSDKVKFNKGAVRIPYDKKTIETYLKDKRYKNMSARKAHLNKGKKATNILRVPSLKGASKEKCGHSKQKPLALIKMLVACSSDPGDTVLDPFLGSGTTAIAAESQKRFWIGIERRPDYLSIANHRLARLRRDP